MVAADLSRLPSARSPRPAALQNAHRRSEASRPGLRRGEDDRIGARELVHAAGVSRCERDLCIQRTT